MPIDWLDTPPFTVAVDGSLSAIAVDVVASGGPTGFYEFDLKRDANGYRGEFAGEQPNLYIEQTVTAVIPKMEQERRNAVMEMMTCNCGMLAMVKDNNCKVWVLGIYYDTACSEFVQRGLRLAAGSAEQTGVDPTADFSQYEITLTTTVWELAREYTDAIPVNP